MRYVILGGSAAGISAAKAIRQNDSSGEVIVISGEKTKPYYRPLIPLLISGQKSEFDILYPDNPLQGKNVVSVLGTAIGLDVKKKQVLLASGERMQFDSLLIATGGAALKPDIPGLNGVGVYPLRSLVHAVQIKAAADRASSAVVIGGGLVGIKAALALRERNAFSGNPDVKVTIIEMLPQILNGRLDKRGAKIVRAAVEREGVAVLHGEKVSDIVRIESGLSGVKLRSGRMIPADLVIVAAGVKPDLGYLKNSGIKTNRGVQVDESLRTNIAGIYAAGDVAEGKELVTGTRTVSGLWSTALEMGRVAGMNMTGGNVKYPGFLSIMNATEIAGVPFISVGLIEPDEGKYETISHENANGYWKLVLDRDLLIGAVFVGDLTHAGIYTNLIKNRIPISRVKSKIKKRSVGYADFVSV